MRILYVIDIYGIDDDAIADSCRTARIPKARQGNHVSDKEREAAINFIAANPEAGISLGGGLRKVRIPREGSGKSGGFRTVYVFGGTHMPIFLITVFAKNEKANLSKTEQAAAVEISKALVAKYGDAT
ncbi:type II toxin-antitoxin system RelE/ParE family toxin [Hoeflea sp. CAU 1731]